MYHQTYDADVIIVGGGSAGCVVASRLSENTSNHVILIEAGNNVVPDNTPADIADIFPLAYANSDYFWPSLTASVRENALPQPFSQARILGGGSSVMGMWAIRGLASDYDNWDSAGAAGWGYRDVLPFFRKLERDLDFQTECHGDTGLIPIRRYGRKHWSGFNEAVANAAIRLGLPYFEDLNQSQSDGVFSIPNSNDGLTRASTATTYLNAAVRRRPNLKIQVKSEVVSLVFEGRKITGVKVKSDGAPERVLRAPWVVLAAGAIHSPALLLKSGVGPGDDLSALGIPTVSDLPEVGQNLQNHVVVHLGAVLRPDARQKAENRSYGMTCVRFSSQIHGARASDLFLGVIGRTGPRQADRGIGMLAAALYSPASRGSVTLATPASQSPRVDFRILSEEIDRKRLVGAAQFARNLLQDESVKAETYDTFILPAKLPIRQLNKPGIISAVASAVLARVVDLNAIGRRSALSLILGRDRLMSSATGDDEFSAKILSSATTMFHPAGTCAIGTVVDPQTRVLNIEGLFVVDASVMPEIPRANTNIPTIMVAEKAASMITDIIA